MLSVSLTPESITISDVYAELIKRGKFAWQLLWTGQPDCPYKTSYGCLGTTGTNILISKKDCAQKIRAFCKPDSQAQTRAMMSATTISLASGLHFSQDASDNVANRFPFAGPSTHQLPEFQQECAQLLLFLALAQVPTHGMPLRSLANFMLTRGPHAFLGHSWKGCSKCVQLRSRSSAKRRCV